MKHKSGVVLSALGLLVLIAFMFAQNWVWWVALIGIGLVVGGFILQGGR